MKPTSAFRLQHSALRFPALFLVVAIAWTWPLATRLAWRIPHDRGDPVLNTWILWWSTQALPFTDAWWSPPIFYPIRGAFALSEHLAGIAIFTVPLNAVGLNPIAAYNFALILCSWLSGYFAFLLGRRLTGSTPAGLIAGLAFALAPYRASQLSHLQVLTSQWMPLALLGMHGYLDEGRRRWLLLVGAAWVLQALSNGYYLLFFPVLVGMWLLWFVDWRTNWRRGLVLVGTFATASVLLLPALLGYLKIHSGLGLRRTVREMMMFSANLTSFIDPAGLLRFWPQRGSETQEGFLFPGVTVVVLTLFGGAALVGRRRVRRALTERSAGLFYFAAALLLYWLCFGPADAAERHSAPAYLRPYTLLMWLPGFNGLRVPARFGMLGALCLAIAAAVAAARIAPAPGWRRQLATALVVAGLFVDGWIEPMPLVAPPARVMIPDTGALVLELPADESSVNVQAMYRAMTHGRPLVNGYSGHEPPHFAVLTHSLRQGDPSVLKQLARGRALVVIVHRRRDPDGDWRGLVEEAGGQLQEESGVGPVFLVPPQPREPAPGISPPLTAIPVDSEAGYAAIDLGSEQVVRAITIRLRWRSNEIGPDMMVEASSDAIRWVNVWDNWTGAAALAAVLEDHQNVPMKIYLPDVRARYIRVAPAPPWLQGELQVYGPQ